MSVAPRRSLYGKLSGDTTLNNLLGTPAGGYAKSIYYEMAPEGAGYPYVILAKLAGTPAYSLKSRAYDNDVWLIKAVDRGPTADPADSIAERIDALVTDGSVSISGRTALYLRRESDVNFAEERDGHVYHHSGAQYRFIYE